MNKITVKKEIKMKRLTGILILIMGLTALTSHSQINMTTRFTIRNDTGENLKFYKSKSAHAITFANFQDNDDTWHEVDGQLWMIYSDEKITFRHEGTRYGKDAGSHMFSFATEGHTPIKSLDIGMDCYNPDGSSKNYSNHNVDAIGFRSDKKTNSYVEGVHLLGIYRRGKNKGLHSFLIENSDDSDVHIGDIRIKKVN